MKFRYELLSISLLSIVTLTSCGIFKKRDRSGPITEPTSYATPQLQLEGTDLDEDTFKFYQDDVKAEQAIVEQPDNTPLKDRKGTHDEGGIVVYRGGASLGGFFPDGFLGLGKRKGSFFDNDRANQLYASAVTDYKRGKQKSAMNKFKDVADRYPFSTRAPLARYNQALLLEMLGDSLKAFDTYQKFITTYFGTSLYGKAVARQEIVAHEAAKGKFTKRFIGLKATVPVNRMTKMFQQVIENAPQADSAPRAQYGIGVVNEKNGDLQSAILAYRLVSKNYPESLYTAEALFRIGVILYTQSTTGNKNNSNLAQASEKFEEIIERFPSHDKAAESKKYLTNIRGLGVLRNYEIARFYHTRGKLESAKFYYKETLTTAAPGSEIYNEASGYLNSLEGQQ